MMRTRTILILPLLLLSQAIAAEEPAKISLSPPALLPDGSKFKTWERPLSFSRTYYVDQAHPQASDENPGTQERPLRTIPRASPRAWPGAGVVVAAGLSRARVARVRPGPGPDRMISYEAAPGVEVVIKGSRVLQTEWVAAKGPEDGEPQLWTIRLPAELFDGTASCCRSQPNSIRRS